MRFAACVEYDGTNYCGWQILGHAPSVQEHVENALSSIAAHPVNVICSGRTDSGVHSVGQIIHFDTEAKRDPRGWLFGTNSKLPNDIALRWVVPIDDDFHARFSAVARRYRYIIVNRLARPGLFQHKVAWVYYPLDDQAMHQASQVLIGEYDFSSFRAAGCQARHAVREIQELTIWRAGEMVYVDIKANAFLHHMVRNIVGSLLQVGTGEKPIEWIAELLALKDRTKAGMTAPAQGLYFVQAYYPERFQLPEPSSAPTLV